MTIESNKNHRKPLKSIVKWAGGKRWMKSFIVDFWKANQCSVFVEPFAGGMTPTLSVRADKSIVNDINPHLINFYRQVKQGLAIALPLENTEGKYKEYRQRFNVLTAAEEWESKDCAELFYYLNKTGYNGLCRFNKKGGFNTPFGRYDTINYQVDFTNLQPVFKDIEFLCTDFENIDVEEIGKDAFYFIDAPYDDSFSGYTKEGFKWEDQLRLIEWASKLEGPVLMTNKATKRMMDALHEAGFSTRKIKQRHSVGASANSRKQVEEVIAWKNAVLPENYPIKDPKWRDTMRGKTTKTKKLAKTA